MVSKFKTALITGVAGSGGSYLADYLVDNHPEIDVHGISRWHSATTQRNMEYCHERVRVHECDLTDFSSVLSTLKIVKPDLIFHIASHANVRASFDTPLSVLSNNVMGTANLLESVRSAELDPTLQLCSTSEVYGQVDSQNVPIDETCLINPTSPYAVSKVTQDFLGATYFRSYGMKIVRTRMFSYINPRRADLFSTAFALQVARIEHGKQTVLRHGNLDSVRTLIDVRDAMEAYWVAIERGKPGEVYNIGGTTSITVGEFLETLRGMAKCPIVTEQDPMLLRPADVTLQIPDTSKFDEQTGWQPKHSFEESVAFLLDHCRSVVARECD